MKVVSNKEDPNRQDSLTLKLLEGPLPTGVSIQRGLEVVEEPAIGSQNPFQALGVQSRGGGPGCVGGKREVLEAVCDRR